MIFFLFNQHFGFAILLKNNVQNDTTFDMINVRLR